MQVQRLILLVVAFAGSAAFIRRGVRDGIVKRRIRTKGDMLSGRAALLTGVVHAAFGCLLFAVGVACFLGLLRRR